MCGIAGAFCYASDAPPVDEPLLLAMRERMRPRGPDDAGLWVSDDRRTGFAHRRLSIIDLTAAGHQPMRDPVSGNVIVFNGEIYNYRALRSELEAVGHRFVSESDTEVLLTLFRVHDVGFLPKLRGMYAFAIYDAAKKRLFLARDPFGIKPLYLADDGRSVRFASQVKALLAGGSNNQPDPAGHAGFFLWGHVPEPFTLFRGIRALGAGASLLIAADGRRTKNRHFDIPERIGALTHDSDVRSAEDARMVLADALRDTVRHHLVADVPVGVFLSSGLDSATMTALTREVALGPLKTVTLGFDEYKDGAQDEVPLAEAVARQYGTEHSSQRVSRDMFFQELDHVLDAMDQPSIDGVNTYFVCQAARRAGLKVALSGLGGDELFAGYSGFGAIPRLVQMASVPSRIPRFGAMLRGIAAPMLARFTSPKYAGVLEYGGSYAGAYLLRYALFMPWELDRVLDPGFARAGVEELQTLAALDQSLPSADNARLKVGALTSAWYMRNQLLRDTDWAGMAHSLEVRTPFVDVPLWETVTRLVLGGHPVGKRDMALSPAMPLPEAVLRRSKTGFSIPVHDWVPSSAANSGFATARGLRGWSSFLYQRAGFAVPMAA